MRKELEKLLKDLKYQLKQNQLRVKTCDKAYREYYVGAADTLQGVIREIEMILNKEEK